MKQTLAVIGVGNMAKAILNGIFFTKSELFSNFVLFDQNKAQCEEFASRSRVRVASSISDTIRDADFVMLAVKPQNYPEVLAELSACPDHSKKIYISIAAGITVDDVSKALSEACVVRVLPNVPMLIGQGVSLVCRNNRVAPADFETVCSAFRSAGSVILIDEEEMNRMIGVTSSSPAYIFRLIQAIADGAKAQGLERDDLIDAICDVVIGSAMLLKSSKDTPNALIQKVASKGGTTEKALEQLSLGQLEKIVENAMVACTKRADELGQKS